MQVKPADLTSHLSGTLAPAYLISGDDTLLVQEACDAVLRAASAEGFSERSVQHVEANFRWSDLLQDAASMSLFAERRILDVRVPAGKFDREASEVLRHYAGHPMDDTLLLIRSGRLDPRQRGSAWFKALDKLGVIVLVWPVGIRELPRWLGRRLQAAGLELEPPAVTYLAQQVEGNLLAAVQEIEKLKLAGLEEPITVDALSRVMEDAAHYDTFELIDAALGADAARVSRMVRNLRQEGVALFAILGALTSQLRRMRGGSGRGMPPQRQRVMEGFLRRVGSPDAIDRIIAQCALIDSQGKGQLLGDAWLSLEDLLLRLAGTRGLPSLEQQLPHLKRA